MKKQTLLFIQALLNSYSIVFFSQHNVLAVLLLVTSFFNPIAGAAGLFAVCGSLVLLKLSGYRHDTTQSGLYSFNSILIGLGFGSFFHFNMAFCVWLVMATALTVMLTVILTTTLAKRGLPALSLPFVVVFWLILLAANGYGQMGLVPKESYMLNELSVKESVHPYQLFGTLNAVPLPYYIRLFFRAVSAILFQDSAFAGLVISIGVLIHSRISLSLLVLGFISACLFNSFTHIYPDGLGHYHLGVNFMMTGMALSGFFIVPSLRSYLLAIAFIPLAYLLTGAFTSLLDDWNLPILSLPFCLIVIGVLYFLKLRQHPRALQLTAYQNYSPEANLYQYLNGQERLNHLRYLNLSLPFMGGWSVSQGYDGGITHNAEWAQALDFVIKDEDHRTCKVPGEKPEDFYCYNKPILACADGLVETVVSHVEDNRIGEINTRENWGNTIVIKHADGLYSKVSHLKPNTAKVKPGDLVKRGDILALCGNSGRSPEPHLHFQMQATPYVGSKTISYPFAYFKENVGHAEQFNSFNVPALDSTVHNIATSSALKQAFAFQPGYVARVTAGSNTETWEVFTDTLNQTYLFHHESGDIAYFVSNDTAFYFTAFYGGRSSLLYKFQLAAYKVIFSAESGVKAKDVFPVNITGSKPTVWLYDLVSPFYHFIGRIYQSYTRPLSNGLLVTSFGYKTGFSKNKQFMRADVLVTNNQISEFTIDVNGKQTEAKWEV
ncbi:urea transporter [Mucilaginibacter sp.]|uniref:urea transporter n=1 Tax=Mucilaginibacter sp. TaxID=1882438 RepID=UPI003267BBE5